MYIMYTYIEVICWNSVSIEYAEGLVINVNLVWIDIYERFNIANFLIRIFNLYIYRLY